MQAGGLRCVQGMNAMMTKLTKHLVAAGAALALLLWKRQNGLLEFTLNFIAIKIR